MNEKEKEIFRKKVEEKYGDSDKGIHKGKTLEQRTEELMKKEEKEEKVMMKDEDGNEVSVEEMTKRLRKQLGDDGKI